MMALLGRKESEEMKLDDQNSCEVFPKENKPLHVMI